MIDMANSGQISLKCPAANTGLCDKRLFGVDKCQQNTTTL